jgi:hypothetical protein
MAEFLYLSSNFKSQYRRQTMNAQPTINSTKRATVIRRVIPASAFRRLYGDIARQKKAKKALRRMRKERNNE